MEQARKEQNNQPTNNASKQNESINQQEQQPGKPNTDNNPIITIEEPKATSNLGRPQFDMEQAHQQQTKKPVNTSQRKNEKSKETTKQVINTPANNKPVQIVDNDNANDDFEYGKVTANVNNAARSVTQE